MTIKDKQEDLINDVIAIRIKVNALIDSDEMKAEEISNLLDKLQDKIFTL